MFVVAKWLKHQEALRKMTVCLYKDPLLHKQLLAFIPLLSAHT